MEPFNSSAAPSKVMALVERAAVVVEGTDVGRHPVVLLG
jgi:hypothetical protein